MERTSEARREDEILLATTDAASSAEADHFLLLLNAQTWTRGEESDALATELMTAMDNGMHILLAHEMPGMGGHEERHACEFGCFFSHADGTSAAPTCRACGPALSALSFRDGDLASPSVHVHCGYVKHVHVPAVHVYVNIHFHLAAPDKLLKRGIYSEIALPLKGGAWREVSQPPQLKHIPHLFSEALLTLIVTHSIQNLPLPKVSLLQVVAALRMSEQDFGQEAVEGGIQLLSSLACIRLRRTTVNITVAKASTELGVVSAHVDTELAAIELGEHGKEEDGLQQPN